MKDKGKTKGAFGGSKAGEEKNIVKTIARIKNGEVIVEREIKRVKANTKMKGTSGVKNSKRITRRKSS